LADEWFLIAQRPVPAAADYEGYPQIGNGVGSIRQFLEEFEASADRYLQPAVTPPRSLTWVVGNAVEGAFQPILERLNQVGGLTVDLAALASPYWGRDITVTGLLTGHDLLTGLSNRPLGEALLLPTVMLKPSDSGQPEDTLFLDDMSVAAVSQCLNCPIIPIDDSDSLVKVCCGPLPFTPYRSLQAAPGYWTPS
jgi:putative radical SAM enzyme (TIGR03279 family)